MFFSLLELYPSDVSRYDFFHKNGVPRWRGTGYYYSRYRPGLGVSCCYATVGFNMRTNNLCQFVSIFLIILSTTLQYVIQRINYRNDLARIDRFVAEARQAAWGPKLIPLEGRRKVCASYATDSKLMPYWIGPCKCGGTGLYG